MRILYPRRVSHDVLVKLGPRKGRIIISLHSHFTHAEHMHTRIEQTPNGATRSLSDTLCEVAGTVVSKGSMCLEFTNGKVWYTWT